MKTLSGKNVQIRLSDKACSDKPQCLKWNNINYEVRASCFVPLYIFVSCFIYPPSSMEALYGVLCGCYVIMHIFIRQINKLWSLKGSVYRMDISCSPVLIRLPLILYQKLLSLKTCYGHVKFSTAYNLAVYVMLIDLFASVFQQIMFYCRLSVTNLAKMKTKVESVRLKLYSKVAMNRRRQFVTNVGPVRHHVGPVRHHIGPIWQILDV